MKANYIKEANVSKELTGNYRKPENKRFRLLIENLNKLVQQIINDVKETEEQVKQAEKMGLPEKVNE